MIKEVAKEVGWSEEELGDFYTKLFGVIRKSTSDGKLDTIHLQDFGKFYVSKNRIDKVILAYIKKIRDGKNIEENKKIIASLWEARKGKDYKRI